MKGHGPPPSLPTTSMTGHAEADVAKHTTGAARTASLDKHERSMPKPYSGAPAASTWPKGHQVRALSREESDAPSEGAQPDHVGARRQRTGRVGAHDPPAGRHRRHARTRAP